MMDKVRGGGEEVRSSEKPGNGGGKVDSAFVLKPREGNLRQKANARAAQRAEDEGRLKWLGSIDNADNEDAAQMHQSVTKPKLAKSAIERREMLAKNKLKRESTR
jgi:hypothetical protein